MDAFSGLIEDYQASDNIQHQIPGNYAVLYTVADDHGNEASAERKVVVFDPASGYLKLLGPPEIFLQVGSPYVDEGVEVMGFSAAQGQVVTVKPVDTATPGLYEVTYQFLDTNQQVNFFTGTIGRGGRLQRQHWVLEAFGFS